MTDDKDIRELMRGNADIAPAEFAGGKGAKLTFGNLAGIVSAIATVLPIRFTFAFTG